MNDEVAQFPRSHNMTSLPVDERAKLDIDEALIPAGKRWEELEASFAKAPAVIPDEDVAEKATELVAMLGRLLARIDAAHDSTKEPYLNAGRIVDNVSGKLKDKVDQAKRDLEARITAYQTDKQAKIEAERAAVRAADEAAGEPEPAWIQPAVMDRRRTAIRTNTGASASLQDKLEIMIDDPKKVPARYLRRPKVIAALISEVRADVAKGDTIAGVSSKKVPKSRVRRGG